ncbi:flagellar biosynthesis regulator FlaF [Roseomonas sp. NAR14]|uniref:Flagellar biosynthesis regulator FlaF n=1 Tax=Roseomonas acroporae TaxID=2937791 RepID=A0A9X2BW48_9PROT|nr:flagellar biosynthesis regulator FlaF [Roseomonas acroporae]MCK8784664.1 flagellar biosynthesis regulator FlaF [Roseomonas acroporae]
MMQTSDPALLPASPPATAAQGAAAYRRRLTPKQMEAEVFTRANRYIRLALAEDAHPLDRARGLADSRRLWDAVLNLVQDPDNALPAALRASLASVAHAVLRECDAPEPDLRFIATINDNIAAGLWS